MHGQFNSGSEREIRDSDSNSNRLNTFGKSINQSLIHSLSNGAEGAVLSWGGHLRERNSEFKNIASIDIDSVTLSCSRHTTLYRTAVVGCAPTTLVMYSV